MTNPQLNELHCLCRMALVDPVGTAKLCVMLYEAGSPVLRMLARAANWDADTVVLYERCAEPILFVFGDVKLWFGPAGKQRDDGVPYLSPSGMRALGVALVAVVQAVQPVVMVRG